MAKNCQKQTSRLIMQLKRKYKSAPCTGTSDLLSKNEKRETCIAPSDITTLKRRNEKRGSMVVSDDSSSECSEGAKEEFLETSSLTGQELSIEPLDYRHSCRNEIFGSPEDW
eukprot:CAMPEP_0183320574 /NCGR_PEP_ID=MMETSP0160_2-20130417/66657_1 /TAXON_ID=2839 ORGANISM="Odontella Sinensis, Strain Grunow 1884" /NCGR_SAMPLE_ID=MMETSP0160_2 /ASSEMBLY_ACC=CAM_ASM_000250 /LENGTH=111 /DNA_ID=CAMNT_0025487291 /DNA_START=42 /DNA_END=374 /DNA_ORIENTATION=-